MYLYGGRWRKSHGYQCSPHYGASNRTKYSNQNDIPSLSVHIFMKGRGVISPPSRFHFKSLTSPQHQCIKVNNLPDTASPRQSNPLQLIQLPTPLPIINVNISIYICTHFLNIFFHLVL